MSEISAYATGASHLYPDCRTVIDVGGQDTKVITLSGIRQGREIRDERPLRRRHRQVFWK